MICFSVAMTNCSHIQWRDRIGFSPISLFTQHSVSRTVLNILNCLSLYRIFVFYERQGGKFNFLLEFVYPQKTAVTSPLLRILLLSSLSYINYIVSSILESFQLLYLKIALFLHLLDFLIHQISCAQLLYIHHSLLGLVMINLLKIIYLVNAFVL